MKSNDTGFKEGATNIYKELESDYIGDEGHIDDLDFANDLENDTEEEQIQSEPEKVTSNDVDQPTIETKQMVNIVLQNPQGPYFRIRKYKIITHLSEIIGPAKQRKNYCTQLFVWESADEVRAK
jgi:hypothetical protein